MSTATTLRDLRTEKGVVIGDGAYGTQHQLAGLEAGACGELWNLEEPSKVEEIHRSYADAGAMFLTTNTFGGTAPRLAMHGAGDRVTEVNRAGAEIARRVADSYGILVAGNIGPTGELIEPLGVLSSADATAIFAEQAAGLAAGGVDFFLIETMSDMSELEAAIAGANQAAPELEVVATMSFDTNLHTMMGVSPAAAFTRMTELGIAGGGGNCGRGPSDMEAVMTQMAEVRSDGPLLVAQSNAGLPHLVGDAFVYDVEPDGMAQHARTLRELGVDVIGGCCGSTPAHVAAMAAALSD
jgi:5-methyltetrahydrofolate--homocysteine methyltransferase